MHLISTTRANQCTMTSPLLLFKTNMPKNIHASLKELGFALGYSKQPRWGYCNGFTLKWLEACFLGQKELRRFTDRAEVIRTKKKPLIRE